MQQQILTLLVGNAGIQLGQAYWNQMMLEHNQNDQSNQILFDEIKEQKIARCLLIDQDSSSIDKILSSSNYQIYNPDNMFAGKQGSQNLFSNGYHIQNIQYFDSIMDQVQKILEQVDNLHAIQFIYSIAGGCGSGLGSKLSEKICDHYTNIPIIHHIIQPSEVERNPLASYNTVLAFQNLVEFSQTVFLHDNQTIIDSNCFTKGLGDINKVITQIMSNHTCSMRFNGLYKTDCLKFQVQTNPFPALHFFSSSLIPLKKFDNKYISRFDQLSERIINKNCSTFKIKEYVGILSGYQKNNSHKQFTEVIFVVQSQISSRVLFKKLYHLQIGFLLHQEFSTQITERIKQAYFYKDNFQQMNGKEQQNNFLSCLKKNPIYISTYLMGWKRWILHQQKQILLNC